MRSVDRVDSPSQEICGNQDPALPCEVEVESPVSEVHVDFGVEGEVRDPALKEILAHLVARLMGVAEDDDVSYGVFD